MLLLNIRWMEWLTYDPLTLDASTKGVKITLDHLSVETFGEAGLMAKWDSLLIQQEKNSWKKSPFDTFRLLFPSATLHTQLPSNPECSAHFSSTVALVLPWQWLTSVCRVTLHSQTRDIWESRPPVMSTFPWVFCSWGGGGRSSQELVRATGRSQHSHSLSHTQIQAASLSLTGTTLIHCRCQPPSECVSCH